MSSLTSLEDDDDDVDDGNAVDGAGGVDLTGGSSSGGGKKSPSFVDDDEESNDADDDESSWSSLVPVVVSSEVTMCVWNTSSKQRVAGCGILSWILHGTKWGIFLFETLQVGSRELAPNSILRLSLVRCFSSGSEMIPVNKIWSLSRTQSYLLNNVLIHCSYIVNATFRNIYT